MNEEDWLGSEPFQVLYEARTAADELSRVAILINNRDDAIRFRLPEVGVTCEWRIAWSADRILIDEDGHSLTTPAHSISLLTGQWGQWGRTTATI
jgi:hypothetical protein